MSDRDVIRDAVKSVDPLVALSRAGAVPDFQADLSFLNPDDFEVGAREPRSTKVVPIQEQERRRKRRAWQVAVAIAAAMALIAVIVYGVIQVKQNPLPADTPSSTAPSPSASLPTGSATNGSATNGAGPVQPVPTSSVQLSSDAQLMVPPADTVPAASNAAQCDMSRAEQIMNIDGNGNPVTNDVIGKYPWLVTVVGCSDQWAVLYASPAYYLANPFEMGNYWFYVARKDSAGKWTILQTKALSRYPQKPGAATLPYPEFMDQQFRAAGIPVELREQLVGNEPIPGTLVPDGPGPKMPSAIPPTVTLDGDLQVSLPEGWSIQPVENAPSGAVFDAQGNKMFTMATQVDGLNDPCQGQAREYSTLFTAPKQIGDFNGVFGVDNNAQVAFQIFDSPPYFAGYGLTLAPSTGGFTALGYDCKILLAAPTGGSVYYAGNTARVLSQDPNARTLQFTSMEDAQRYVRSEEFAQLVRVIQTVQPVGQGGVGQ